MAYTILIGVTYRQSWTKPMRGVVNDRATEAERVSRQLAWVAKVLIDFGLPPIENIPRLPQMAQDALPMVALVVERMQEALDSSTDPWD
jgi:predicted component of type VI protein secretion system